MIFLQDSTDLVTATEKLSEQRVADAAISMVRSAELDHEPKERWAGTTQMGELESKILNNEHEVLELKRRLKDKSSDASETSESSRHRTDDAENLLESFSDGFFSQLMRNTLKRGTRRLTRMAVNEITKPPQVDRETDGDLAPTQRCFRDRLSGKWRFLEVRLGWTRLVDEGSAYAAAPLGHHGISLHPRVGETASLNGDPRPSHV